MVHKQDIYAIREALESLMNESASIINAASSEPLLGSMVADELASYGRPVSIKTALAQSNLALESAMDHLSAFLKCLQEPVETIAPWTLARAVMEAASVSIWIGRTDISAHQRVLRSLCFRLQGIREQAKLARSVPNIREPQPEILEALVRTASEVGAPVIYDKNGTPRTVGVAWPGSTNLCSSELGDELTYRILSAFTHSQPFAMQQLSFRVRGPRSGDEDQVDAEKGISNISVAFLCMKSGTAVLRALAARLKVHGYLVLDTVKVLRARADQLRLSEDQFRYCIWSG